MVGSSEKRPLTPYGKEVRKLRIDLDVGMRSMAAALGCSVAHLSAVETGKKAVPATLIERIVEIYGLDGDVANRLRQAEYRSRDAYQLIATTPLARDVAAQLSRRFHELSEDDYRAISEIVCRA